MAVAATVTMMMTGQVVVATTTVLGLLRPNMVTFFVTKGRGGEGWGVAVPDVHGKLP